MNRRRNKLLEEMGLGPVWVLRDRGTQEAPGDGAVATAPDARSSATKMVPTQPAQPSQPPQHDDTRPPVRQRASVLATSARATDARGSGSARAPGELRALQKPLAPEFPALSNAERDAHIAGMDWTVLKVAVSGCTACGLATTRTQTVFGVGDELADWMLVGEAPGADEDVRGEPFVGQAGKLLDNMLFAIDLARGENVYIANVLKCRPPGNRNPLLDEVARCSPHLERQVALVQPRLILALGRFAAQTLLGTDASIASLRGKLHQYQGVPVIVTYHPAYLLRTPLDKAKAWEDLVFARQTMATFKTAGTGGAEAGPAA